MLDESEVVDDRLNYEDQLSPQLTFKNRIDSHRLSKCRISVAVSVVVDFHVLS
jgi:hypothetical protein